MKTQWTIEVDFSKHVLPDIIKLNQCEVTILFASHQFWGKCNANNIGKERRKKS